MVGFRMKAAFLALMAISASLAVAQHPMAVAAGNSTTALPTNPTTPTTSTLEPTLSSTVTIPTTQTTVQTTTQTTTPITEPSTVSITTTTPTTTKPSTPTTRPTTPTTRPTTPTTKPTTPTTRLTTKPTITSTSTNPTTKPTTTSTTTKPTTITTTNKPTTLPTTTTSPLTTTTDDPKCASASTKRVECGHSGTDQTECEEVHGCCWSPLTPDPTEAPWCFHKTGDEPTPKPDTCDVPQDEMEDCGHMGTGQADCEAAGCCWQPISPNPSNKPWCHKPSGGPGPDPGHKTTKPPGPPSGKCGIADEDKLDCGTIETGEAACEAAGCCWHAVDPNPANAPWCYYSTDYHDPCGNLTWTEDGPGFTDEFYNLMLTKYQANLNIDGSGAVVAAPDKATPGGSYYYHWMRDAGLSIKAWLDINDNDLEKVEEILTAYAGWVKKVQGKTDPNDIDVRIEPKFEIPSGDPYTGGWCRPQTDGPALRAMALSKWGMVLHKAGRDTSDIWGLVSHDLEWVTENWQSEGCDLWEEVRSKDFYFNRAAYIYSLNTVADFADLIGQDGSAFKSKAGEILEATKPHYGAKGDFIYETDVRPQDGAVIHSIATFGEYIYGPESEEAAATIKKLTHSFCREYKLNQNNINAGKSGILIGRYPGDHYAGGNPWQLLTAVLGELFYLGGKATLEKIEAKGVADYRLVGAEKDSQWIKLLDQASTGNIRTARDLATAQLAAGDSVMTRLYEQVKDDGGRIDEQIDRDAGGQKSAKGLTWSYANILHSLHTRKGLAAALEAHP